MKKKLLVALVTVFAVASLALVAGCGGSQSGDDMDYSGTWVFEQAESGGTTYTASDLSSLGVSPTDMCTLELKADGTFDLTMFGQSMFADSDSAPTWVKSATGVSLSSDSSTIDGVYSDGMLTLEVDDETLSLKKQ